MTTIKSNLSVELVDHMGSDQSIIKAARVSFAADSNEVRTEKQDIGLINYLAKHKHITPFQHTSITVRMQAPLPIRTQCFKHKVGFSENEESRRYISTPPEFFIPEAFRKMAENKKQGSSEDFLEGDQETIEKVYKTYVESANNAYEALLALDVCEEQSRFLLPQCSIVNWYWTGSIAAFARFYNQRTDSHAQKEIQILARQVGELLQPLYPNTWNALTA